MTQLPSQIKVADENASQGGDSDEGAVFDVASELRYRVANLTTFVLKIAAAAIPGQRIMEEQITVSPEIAMEEHVNPDNSTRIHRLNCSGATELAIDYRARVRVWSHHTDPGNLQAAPPGSLPLSLLTYLYPSRYCQSDHLLRLASAQFGGLPPGYPQVIAICDWLVNNVEYLYGTTGPLTTAYETAVSRVGVCRDFTHLAIALCRALNIPARYVSGYAANLDPPDFHAVFEAWLGDGWYVFDPTGKASPERMVRIDTGRDAADAAFGILFGPAYMTHMSVSCHLVEGESRLQSRIAPRAVGHV